MKIHRQNFMVQSTILPSLLMTSCKSTYCQLAHTDIMRPNFELKNANKATTTYPIISILAIIDHRGFKVFLS